jgi:hypothetical protein
MAKRKTKTVETPKPAAAKPSSLVDTRVIYCGDNLDQLRKLPDGCVDLIYIDPPFNSNRNYEVFWGEQGSSSFQLEPENQSQAGMLVLPSSVLDFMLDSKTISRKGGEVN